jgi:hypothetical protein
LPDNVAAFWSAVAASFAALSSFLIMLIQRRTLLESARPELVLIGWSRKPVGKGDAAHELLTFQTIKNVGRGTALHVHFQCFMDRDNYPLYMMSTLRLPILASNETAEMDGAISLWWKNVRTESVRHMPVLITIWCWDSRGRRHETRYNLFVVEQVSGAMTFGGDTITPGVTLTTRTTTTRPVWWLKFIGKLKRIRDWGRRLARFRKDGRGEHPQP